MLLGSKSSDDIYKMSKLKIKKLTKRLSVVLIKLLGISEIIRCLEDIQVMTAYTAWLTLLRDEKYNDDKSLVRYGFKVYSQAEEDGILHEIFRRVGIKNRTFLEIGVSNGIESNTLYFLSQGWSGAWIDGEIKYAKEIETYLNRKILSEELKLLCAYVTTENINTYIGELGLKGELDLLSIDIDGNDYHLLKEISIISPRVIVLEYNPTFAPPIQWVMEYDPSHRWDGTDCYGASLEAYDQLLSEKGYSLVGCTMNGNNAFFVRNDIKGNYFCNKTSADYHYEPQRFWLTKAFKPGHNYGDKSKSTSDTNSQN